MYDEGIVSTIGNKCKRCYSCIRECPANAIRVINSQAVVIQERCINCGHCVKVCSQNAKLIKSDVEKVLYEFLPGGNTVIMLAPSFAVSFPDNYLNVIGALRRIGFEKVFETAFGADLISPLYSDLFEEKQNKTIISSPCPAIYNYIEKYYAELVPLLAEVVSPMAAMGRYIKSNYGDETKVVFAGPCIAKKSEYLDPAVENAVDSVITFTELKSIFNELNININETDESYFDPPYAFYGKSFPLTGGLLKTAGISGNILEKDVIIVDGKERVEEIIQDVAENKIKNKFIDILFCEGCINGPAIDSKLNYYSKREKVIEYLEKNIHYVDKNRWKSELFNNRDIKLNRTFKARSMRKPMPSEEQIKEILARTDKYESSDELNCGACGYQSCRDYAVSIAKGLAEEDMCLPYLITKLENANNELQSTQQQLNSAEKLASIGQLAAGVAHEINNPLGTIMLFASMLKKDIQKHEECKQNLEDLKTIIDEANRCKGIVSNLLNFARQGKLKVTKFNLKELLDECIKSVKIKPEYESLFINLNTTDEISGIEGDRDQIKQIMLNLINNACEAVEDSEEKNIAINLRPDNNFIIIDVIDSGCGISDENMKKLFTPFFTTKKIGKGTGLGLAIAYGIIKMHRGDIKVKSHLGNGSTFTVKLPVNLTHINISMN